MSVQRPLRPRSAMTPCWSTEFLRKSIRRMGLGIVCDEEGALVLVLGEGKLEKGEPSGLEDAAMRYKRKQGVNAILLGAFFSFAFGPAVPSPSLSSDSSSEPRKGAISTCRERWRRRAARGGRAWRP